MAIDPDMGGSPLMVSTPQVPTFGRIDDPEGEWDDIEPFPFALVGYRADTRDEVSFEFMAIGRLSLGAQWDAASAVNMHGKVDNSKVAEFLAKNLVPEHRGRFFETISDDDYLFHIDALMELAEFLRELREKQIGRPMQPSNGSRATRRAAGRTSAPERAATGTRSRSTATR